MTTTSSLRSRAIQNAFRVVKLAEGQWNALGQKPKGSWQHRLHTFGEDLLATIDAEEWFLKEVPSSISKDAKQTTIPLHHPTHLSPSDLQRTLHELVIRRIPYHQRNLRLAILLTPFTAALSILPGPNVFLLYNLVRVYDHYRAYNGATALKYCLTSSSSDPSVKGKGKEVSNVKIVSVPDPTLDKVWDAWRNGEKEDVEISSKPSQDKITEKESFTTESPIPPTYHNDGIIEDWVIKRISQVEAFGDSATFDKHMTRARNQFITAVKKVEAVKIV
ncbi:hypothetical protein HDU76_000775 [Blyttiomyces sp. JEL0837]|nr:hypothetical protein HDU76_000775 [Blyttiomyces sp. JEL0837]